MKIRISKKICVFLSFLLSAALLLSLTACSSGSEAKVNTTDKEPLKLSENETAIYISTSGSDENDGSFEKPFLTFEAAQKQLRKINDSMQGNIYIVFREGVYKEKIALYQTDSGENGFNVIIKSYPDENVEIFGGREVSGFKKVKGKKYYKTVLEDTESVRQFYANGDAQPRSTSTTRVLPSDWLNGSDAKDGFLIKTEYLQGIKNTNGLELRLSYQWQDIIVPIKGIRKCSDTMSCIYMSDTPRKLYSTMTGTATELSSGLRLEFFLENSVDLIDEPGEWAFDNITGELWYYPAENVDMESAVFEIPQMEQLLSVEGLDGNTKTHDITVEGLNFRMGAWDVPTELGFISWQADAYWENVTVYPNVTYNQMSGNVSLKNCENITVKNNTFKSMGSTALTASEGVSNSVIDGNAFSYCAAGAVSIGKYNQGTALSTDADNQLCDGITVSNNTVYRMGQSYYSVIGLQVYFGRNITLAHNDILYTPNSGISIGWGWNPEVITTTENIKITHNNISFHGMTSRDSGGIYTLGKQNDCVIEDNYIKDNGFSEKGIYHDQGTGGYTNSRNVLDMQQSSYWTNDYHKNTLSISYNDNYTSTSRYVNRTNSVHNNTTYVLDRNWPIKAQQIILGAGVSAESGSVRAKAFGVPSDKLGLWLSADSGVVLGDSGKITAWKDFSGNSIEAQVKSGEVAWASYAYNENHAIKLDDNSSIDVKDITVSDKFTVSFVASFDKGDKVADILKTVGIDAEKSPDSDEISSVDNVSYYLYSTNGKKGVLYQNGNAVAEWKSNAPKLKNEPSIGNNGALLFELMYFNSELSDAERTALYGYICDKYALGAPTQESLLLWLDAEKLVTADKDGQVSAWGDSSDRRIGGLIQRNSEYMPKLIENGIGGKPAILFDGKDDSMFNFSTRWVGEETTMFVVAELQKADSQSFGSVNGIKEFLTEIKADGSIVTGDNVPNRVTASADSFKFDKPQVLTYQRYPLFKEISPTDEVWLSTLPGVIRLWNGGELLGEYSHYTNKNDTEWHGLALGSNDLSTLNGKISEILVYDRLLTDNERENVLKYLNAKYGLAEVNK